MGVVAEGRIEDGALVATLATGEKAELTVVAPSDATGAPGEVAVGDRIVATERARLDELGVGWLDRRGHLRFRHRAMLLDLDVPPVPRARARHVVDPLAGAVVSAVSVAALLAHPEPMPGVRALARSVGASPGGVSLAVRRLIEAGYLTRDRRAAVPGLFWAVADGWRPDWVPLAASPPPEPDTVLVGDRAAAALGAPVGGTSTAVELLAADPSSVRRLRRTCGVSTVASAAPARIALALTSLAVTRRGDGNALAEAGTHPVAHPVIVALTLAGDAARGAEIVRDWSLDGRPW